MQLKVPPSRRQMSMPAPEAGSAAREAGAEAAGLAPGAVVAPAPAPAVEAPGIVQIGVVCVHGIGFQQPGETLLEWTGPIATALVGWRSRLAYEEIDPADRDLPRDLVERSDVDLTGAAASFVTFRIPGVATIEDATPQRWTFTEAYWAARVEPPSLRLLIDWTGREGVVGRVVRAILGRNAPPFLRRPVEIAGVLWLGVFVSALTSLVLLGYAILRSVLAIIPIQAAKDFVAYGQGERFLVGWWGDARSLVRDPVQSATVRLSLDAAIADLRSRGCERIVVIAHSGGTIVSYMALSDPALTAVADTLITHGQAIELGRRLEDLEPTRVDQLQLQPSVSRIRQVGDRADLRIARWRDYYASHDPAPLATPTDLVGDGVRPGDGASEVTNLSSIREDHGGYWANDEGFVLPVLTEIERAGIEDPGPTWRSRFTRPAATDEPLPAMTTDDGGRARRESRVAMRSLWGRLSLVGPLVAILFAAGVAGGNIDDAAVLDVPSDLLAANYDRLPFSDLGASINQWVTGALSPEAQDVAIGVTRGVFFLLFVVAALWACIPVGGWRRMPRGAVVADALTSLAVPVAALIGVLGLGGVAGIPLAPEFRIVALVVLAVIAVSAVVYWLSIHDRLPQVDSTILSVAAALVVLGSVLAVVIAFIVQEATRRWVVDVAFAVIAVKLVVGLGMWRWNAWDAAERQWFRGARSTPSSRFAIYAIAVALGLLVVALVLFLGGLEAPLRAAGVPFVEYLGPALAIFGGALVLYLVVRDVTIAESVKA